MDVVWASLCQIFGSRVIQQFGERMPDMWRRKLAACTRHELLRALDHFASSGGSWPPTLPEFWQACGHRSQARLSSPQPASIDTAMHHLTILKNWKDSHLLNGDNHALRK